MSKLQNELREALQSQQSADKVRKHLEQLDKRLEAEYKQVEALAEALEKEDKYYEKLQQLSLKGLFYSVLGNKQQQMEKEKQEYLQASLKYDDAIKTSKLMEYERKVLQEKLDKLVGIDKKVAELLQLREREMTKSGSPQGRQLLAISQKIEAQLRMDHEIVEALAVADETVEVLASMFNYLQKARNWGNWNRRGKGGIVNTMIRRSNVDQARTLASRARFLLQKFEDELRDIYTDVGSLDLSLNMDSFVRFTDIFFDNLISDWIVRQKIQNALAAVRSVHDRVKRMSTTLLARRRSLEATLNQLEEQKEQLLAGG